MKVRLQHWEVSQSWLISYRSYVAWHHGLATTLQAHLEALEKVTIADKLRKLRKYANPKRYQIEPEKYLSKYSELNAQRDLGLATLCILLHDIQHIESTRDLRVESTTAVG